MLCGYQKTMFKFEIFFLFPTKKRKDSKTPAALLIFSLPNLGARTENTSERRKMVAFLRNYIVKMTLRQF